MKWPRRVRSRNAASSPRRRIGEAFTVVLARSSRSVPVREDQSILDALENAGVAVPSDCRFGVCGTCVTTVVSGHVDHRDMCLTQQARLSSMAICVSRADQGSTLSLDL